MSKIRDASGHVQWSPTGQEPLLIAQPKAEVEGLGVGRGSKLEIV